MDYGGDMKIKEEIEKIKERLTNVENGLNSCANRGHDFEISPLQSSPHQELIYICKKCGYRMKNLV